MSEPGSTAGRRKLTSPVSGLVRMLHLILRSPDRPTSGYDAFISYSHLADDALAATLQAGLESFASPWYRSRTLRVFRDTTDLTATPGLLTEITGALSASRWFVLVASEQAAQSRWVNDEVAWWLANRDHERLLIALSGGEILWKGRDFDWEHTTALPPALAGAFTEEPGWIDLREVKRALAKGGDAASFRRRTRLTRQRARRQVGDWVAALAAPIREVAKDTLVGEHLRHRKQTRRMVQAVLAGMLTLTVAASAATFIAANQLGQARRQTRIATSRELAALSGNLLTRHLDLAELFAVEAYRLDPTPQALSALFQAVTASPHLVTYLPAGGQVSAAAGSADGRVIVAGRSDGTVLRWSLPDTQPTVIARMTKAVTGVSVNDSGTAAVAFNQAEALRWGASTGGRRLRIPAGHSPAGVGISASGRFTALATSTAEDGSSSQFELALYDQKVTQVDTATIRSETVGPLDISFAGDSRLVALDSNMGTWHRLSVPDLRPMEVSSVRFLNRGTGALSPAGKFVGFSTGQEFDIWKTRAGTNSSWQLRSGLSQSAVPTAVAINAAGTLAAQDAGGSIYVSRITGGASTVPLILAGNSTINAGVLAFAGPSELVSASGDLLALWDLRQYSRIATETSITAPFSCEACSGPLVALQPNGRRVAVVAGSNTTLTEQALPPRGKPATGRSSTSSYGMPDWSQDGRHLLVPTEDGGAQIWSAPSGFTKSSKWGISAHWQKAIGNSQATAMQFRPDGRQAIEVDTSGNILVRNAITGKVHEFIKRAPNLKDFGGGPPNLTAVDAAGQAVAVASPRGVVVTSIATRRSRTLPGSFGETVAFYGEKLLVQRPDGSLQIWSADASRLIKVIAGMANVVAGPVVDRAGLAAETGPDGSAVVVDLNSGVTLGTIYPPAGPKAYSIGIAMSTAGTSLVTVTEAGFMGGPGELTDWQMSVSAWLKVACTSAGHDLTSADWQEYVGGPPPAQLACAGSASSRG